MLGLVVEAVAAPRITALLGGRAGEMYGELLAAPERGGDGNVSLTAVDRGDLRGSHGDAAQQRRNGTARMAESYGSALVDAGRAEVGAARHGVGSAQHHGSEGHTVDADIQQRSARQLRREQPAGGIDFRREGQVALKQRRHADFACLQQRAQRRDGRDEAGPHALHQQHAAVAGAGRHGARLGGVDGERFLAQHVLAGIEADAAGRRVLGMGSGHVDGVHGRVGGQRRVAAMRLRGPVLGGKRLGTGGGARTDGHQPRPGGVTQSGGKAMGNAAGPQNAPIYEPWRMHGGQLSR